MRLRGIPLVGGLVALLGGLVLVVGPFSLWASVTVDTQAFAQALHEDVRQIAAVVDETSGPLTWLEANTHGDLGLALGVTVVVLAVLALLRAHRGYGASLIVVGAIAMGVAAHGAPRPDALRDHAVELAAPWAIAVGVDRDVIAPTITIESGSSTQVCMVGGALAIIGGIVVLVGVRTKVPAGVGAGVLSGERTA